MIEKQIRISSFDVLPNGTVKPSALLRHMQQAAREDCDAMGCTYPYMREQNTVFVLIRLALQLNRPIFDGETLTLRTFNNRIDGLYFDREYFFLSEDGEAARCSSFWVLMRYDTRRPVRPKDFPIAFEEVRADVPALEIPRSFASDDLAFAETRKVRLSDLDENNHLNNCIYADIMLDALASYDPSEKTVKSLRIIFRHEARKDDVLSLSLKEDGDTCLIVADNTTSQNPCFESDVSFSAL